MIERHPSAFYAHRCYVTSMSKNEKLFIPRLQAANKFHMNVERGAESPFHYIFNIPLHCVNIRETLFKTCK